MTPAVAVLLAERGAGETIAGLSALERLVRGVLAAEASSVYVLGDDGLRLPPRLAGDPRIRLLRAGSPEARAALEPLSGQPTFLLGHTELAVEPDYFRRLRAAGNGGPLLAVVPHEVPGPVALPLRDLRSALRSPDLGGTASAGSVVSTGLLPGSLAPALSLGEAGLPEALREALARGAQPAPPDVGHVWTAASSAQRARATRGLIRAAGKETDGVVARHLNRRFSGALTRLLLATPVSPSTLTALTLLLGLAAGAVAGTGALVAGTLLYQLASMLDGCDGELARLRFQVSRRGERLDSLADQAGNLAFMVGVPLGVWRLSGGEPVYAWMALFNGVGLLAMLWAVYLSTRRVSDAANFSDFGRSLVRSARPRSLRARVLSFLTAIARRDFYALFFFLLALAGQEELVAWILTLSLAGHFPALLIRPRPGPGWSPPGGAGAMPAAPASVPHPSSSSR